MAPELACLCFCSFAYLNSSNFSNPDRVIPNRSAVCADGEESAISFAFAFDLEVSAGAPSAGVAGGRGTFKSHQGVILRVPRPWALCKGGTFLRVSPCVALRISTNYSKAAASIEYLPLCHLWHNILMELQPYLRPLIWIGGSRADLSAFPEEVKDLMGFALYVAQRGEKHIDAKPLRGFKGAGVLEIVGNSAGDTFRAVYTVRLEGRVYVLHAFQKKSKSGSKTPKSEIDLIHSRLRRAEELHAEWQRNRS